MAYTAQLPLLFLGYPSRLTGRKLDQKGLVGGMELDGVDLVGLDEAGGRSLQTRRQDGCVGELHDCNAMTMVSMLLMRRAEEG